MPKKNHALVDYYLQTNNDKSKKAENKLTELIANINSMKEKEQKYFAVFPTLINVGGPLQEKAESFKMAMTDYIKNPKDDAKRRAANTAAEKLRENAKEFCNTDSDLKKRYGLENGNEALGMIVNAKTASEYIKEVQHEAEESHSFRGQDFARIFAARMIANSDRGSKEKLVNTIVDPNEVNALADKLNQDDIFCDFVKDHAATMDEITHGHGGRLEDAFKEYIKNLPDDRKANMDYELLDRFNVKSECYSYGEFIQKNKDVPGKKKMNLQYLDSVFETDADGAVRASKLMAAYKLMGKGEPYSEARLNKEAEICRNDPQFKLLLRDKHVKDAILKGDMETVTRIQTARKNEYKGIDQENIDDIRKMVSEMKGENDPKYKENLEKIESLEEGDEADKEAKIARLKAKNEQIVKKTLASRSPEYRAMVKAAENVVEKYDKNTVKPRDYAKAIDAVLTYQDGKEGGSIFSSRNKRFDNSMSLLGALTYTDDGELFKRYVHTQLDKVNKARNYAPESEKYMTPDKLEIDGSFPFEDDEIELDRDILEDREARGLKPVDGDEMENKNDLTIDSDADKSIDMDASM